MSENLVMVFTRNPELGKVKTRLAKTIGDKSALIIYTFLLNHTEKTIRNIDCDKAIYYSSSIEHNDIWDNTIYQKHLQQGNNLGEKIQSAFDEAFFKGYKKAVIIGSDLLDLKPKHIKDVFKKLDNHDVVIGPALDGGYYLLGMKTLNPLIFENKKWGTSTVFRDTMENLQDVDVHLLEKLNDIDTYEDLKEFSELKKLISLND